MAEVFRKFDRQLFLIIALGILLPFAAYQVPMSPVKVDLGERADGVYVQNFYHRERGPYDSYRWSGKQSFAGDNCVFGAGEPHFFPSPER